jgi:hypothetical protein
MHRFYKGLTRIQEEKGEGLILRLKTKTEAWAKKQGWNGPDIDNLVSHIYQLEAELNKKFETNLIKIPKKEVAIEWLQRKVFNNFPEASVEEYCRRIL